MMYGAHRLLNTSIKESMMGLEEKSDSSDL